MNKYIFFILLFVSLLGVQCNLAVSKIEGQEILVDEQYPIALGIDSFIQGYRAAIEEEMNEVLCYNPSDLSKKDGDLNTAIGNMMADLVLLQANPLFYDLREEKIDIVLLNYGGIRSSIPKGEVTMGSAFKLMPFENEIVVLKLMGEDLLDMMDYLEEAETAHPISGMTLRLSKEGQIVDPLVGGHLLEEDKAYYLATNDYLYHGGDNMVFLDSAEEVYKLNYKIRDAIIDYFTAVDTLNAVIDERFIREK